MQIRIETDEHSIRLWLPTSMLKARVFYRILRHGAGKNAKNAEKAIKKQPSESLPEPATQEQNTALTRKQQLELYRTLRAAIKANGHFNIVEIESADGDKVLIRV